jgi:hypothetical protein
MADGPGFLQKLGDFIRGPREPSSKERAQRALAAIGEDPTKTLDHYETDLTLQYLTTVGADFSPADLRNLQIRARWGDPRWLYSIYDTMPRLGPGPQMRKMLEAIRGTEDQYKTTPEDADPDAVEEGSDYSAKELQLAVEARDYVETVLTPWSGDIQAHMARAELYGIAAGEIVTDPRGLKWRGGWKERIVDFRPIAERRFRIDPGSHEWLLMLSPLTMEGPPILPLIQRGKLLWYEIGAGTEQLDQRGLCFQLLLPWAIQNYCVRWRAKRVEKYGVPPAIGKVPIQDAKRKVAMEKALADFAASMYMVIGEKETVEFANALAQGRIDPQAQQIDWCSQMFDMILLGDTQASQVQVGAGSKQSKDQAIAGFKDLTNSRILRLNTSVFNRQLIPGLVFRNFGEDVASMHCPTIESTVPESDDATALSAAALNIANAGFAAKIDSEDLVRRCTLQVASEDDQEEAAAAEQEKAAQAAAAKGSALRGLPAAGKDEKEPGGGQVGGGSAASAETRKKLLAAGKAAGFGSDRVVHFGRRKFMTAGDFQQPAHEPVVFPDGSRPRIKLVSYGHENGPVEDADANIDARGLGYSEDEGYGEVDPARTGRDPAVQGLIKGGEKAGPTYGGIKSAALRAISAAGAAGKHEITVGVGCDHGRHRSVYVVERLAHELRQAGHDATHEHRDADRFPLHGREQMAVQRTKRTREMQQKIAEKVRAHLKVMHRKALAEGEKALSARAAAK